LTNEKKFNINKFLKKFFSFIIPLCYSDPTFWLRFHLRLISVYPLIKNQTLLLSGFDLFIRSLTHTLSLSLSLSNTDTHTHTRTHKHTYTHTHSQTPRFTHTHTLTHKHTDIHICTHSHSDTHTHTHTLTQYFTHIYSPYLFLNLTQASTLTLFSIVHAFFNPSQLLHPNPQFPHVFSPARDIPCQRIIMIREMQTVTRDSHVTPSDNRYL